MIYKNNHSVIAAIEAAVLNCQLGIHPRYFWFNKGNNKNKTNKKTQVCKNNLESGSLLANIANHHTSKTDYMYELMVG